MIRSRSIEKLSAVTIALVLSGCAFARVVSVQPKKGGVITVAPAQDPEAREKANALMAANCGAGKYEITEEGEVVVGTTSSSSMSADPSYGSHAPMGYTANSSTENKTEWRLTYKCKA